MTERSRLAQRGIAVLRLPCFVLTLGMMGLVAAQDTPPPPPRTSTPPPAHVQQSPEQLQQLVAPIALYPDSLVAQVLAASTFPEQVVEADRWLQGNSGLQGDALAQAADGQPWDPSVKALTAFPTVLGNMDKNLSWTSSLGDAYFNQPDDVMAAVQVMRQRASAAGNLKTTPQQVVSTQGQDIDIEPAASDFVYVPAYDPWVVYGAPLIPWPDWYLYPGIWYEGPYLSFGIGVPIGFFGGFGWGWHHWGFDWPHRHVLFDHNPYLSHSTTFYNRGNFYRGGRPNAGFAGAVPRGTPAGRAFGSPGVVARPFDGNVPAARGYAAPRGESGIRSGVFSGYNRGGETRSFASRGSTSFGGGGARSGGRR
jgi:hypothetical protein